MRILPDIKTVSSSVLRGTVFYCIMLCLTVVGSTALYLDVGCFAVLYPLVLCHIVVLCSIGLCSIVLYCVVLHCVLLC